MQSQQQALQKSIRILTEREESLNKDLLARVYKDLWCTVGLQYIGHLLFAVQNSEIAEKIDLCFKLEKSCSELEGKLKVC